MFKIIMLLIYIFLIIILFLFREMESILFVNYTAISILFICYLLFTYSVRFFLKVRLFSAFSIFYISCILFFGGRILSHVLGSEDIFRFDFFFYKDLNLLETNYLMYYVFIGFISLEVGLLLSLVLFKENHKIIYTPVLEFRSVYIVFSSVLYGIYTIFNAFQVVLISKNYGYESLYMSQVGNYSTGIFSSILTVFIGIFLSQNNEAAKKILLFSMFISTVLYLLAGKRAEILSFIFLMLWLYADYGRKALSKKAVFVGVGSVFFVIIFFYSFSFRSVSGDIEGGGFLANLLYELGGTLLIFEHSMTNEIIYPIIPYIQSFIPGTSLLAGLFLDSLDAKDTMFSLSLSYQTSPDLFFNGFGLGWSFLSDAYVFGFKNILFYSLFIILFSILINFLQYSLSNNIYSKVILCTILMKLVFLPRDSISSIFPIMWYCILITYLFSFSLKAKDVKI